jgi:flavin-dependent dehydrogenase
MRRDADIVVAGASTAGLLTAALLAESGRRVILVDQNKQVDPAHRSLIVTSRLQDVLGDCGQNAITARVDRFELTAGDHSITVSLQEPDFVIERRELINLLAHRARAAGVELRMGQRIAGMRPFDSGVRVNVDGAGERLELRAPVVIGADGASSEVASAAGWPRLPTLPLVQALVPAPSDVGSTTSQVWFRPQDSPYFYWLIPETNSRAAIGFIGERGHEARRCLDSFLVERGLDALAYQAARIPLYLGWTRNERRFGGGRVFLVGDAAGHVKVSTVGGVVTGFRGALGVVERILGRGPSSHLRILRRELNAHLLVRKAIHHFDVSQYERLLRAIDGPASHRLGRHTRDEAVKVLWQFARARPRLLAPALTGLLLAGSIAPSSKNGTKVSQTLSREVHLAHQSQGSSSLVQQESANY